MPKKNNPGCNCCDPVNCEDQCLYKCTGTPCTQVCSIRIEVPDPDLVDQGDGPSCPPSDCAITAKCQACKTVFDGYFNFWFLDGNFGKFGWLQNDNISELCDNYKVKWYYLGDDYIVGQPQTAKIDCWKSYNYDCPYENSYQYDQCFSEYYLRQIYLTFEVTYADGCSTTTVTIEYEVVQTCDLLGIPPNPPSLPLTKYTHIFQRTNQCACDEILGQLGYVSTTSENNWRGVTVPDVCNMESATITLSGQGECRTCHCFDCFTPGDLRTVTITNGDYAGTYVLFGGNNSQPTLSDFDCYYVSSVPGFVVDGKLYQISLVIYCFPCEVYTLVVTLINRTDGTSQELGRSEFVGCSDPLMMSSTYDPGVTIEVS